MEVKTLVLTGYGINCDFETQNAFKTAGAHADRVHFNDVLQKNMLKDYHILAIPGGFSFADDIASGKVFANKLRFKLQTQIQDFIDAGKLAIGICNGFQILVKAGLLPNPKSLEQTTTLTFNDSGHFEDRWVCLKNADSRSVWTKGIKELALPVRHGEGKFIAGEETLALLNKNKQIVFRYFNPHKKSAKNAEYPWNPNGSMEDIAGICDETGRVFGLMPHPEAFCFATNHPRWTRGEAKQGEGLKVFENAVEYARKKLV
ncbi:MAG: phosphoribosylformylglycinamidine synthase I [Candidatus Norongarragalinales archaeon]